MSNEKEYTEGIAVRGKFLRWLDNYWYHYKWPTIITAFFLVVITVCTVQACTKEEYDMSVVYAGRQLLRSDELEKVSSALEAVVPKDIDADGDVSIQINAYNILSKEQIQALRAEKNEDEEPTEVNTSFFSTEHQTYSNYLQTGESFILLLDRWEYDNLASTGALVALSEVLGSKPQNAISDYGIRLGDTALYRNFEVMKVIPEDTVVCMMRLPEVYKRKKAKQYENEKQMFIAMITPATDNVEGAEQ
jgi:hypothetical protein